MQNDEYADSSPGADSLTPSTKRKRASAATTSSSSRGVANLTPEQLQRKRANDREAQRAIRERTKQQIDRLNERIRELESQQPYNDLQVVVRQKEAIHAENDEIKRRLASVIAIIQPLLGNQSLHDLAAAAERNSLPAAQAPVPLPPNGTVSKPPYGEDAIVRNNPGSQEHSLEHVLGNNPPPQVQNNGQWSSTAAMNGSGESRGWQQTLPQPSERPPAQYSQDERLGVKFLLESNQQAKLDMASAPTRGTTTTAAAQVVVAADYNGRQPPPYAMLPNMLEATCPLDGLMLDFMAERRGLAARGTPMRLLTGPAQPNFAPLLYPDRDIETHPLSRVFADILRTFPDISTLPEQVATIYVMFSVMRWELDPTQENYDRLPDWMTPRPSQLFTPHPSWMDHLPWPKLRDKMVSQSPHQPFDTFFIPFTTTISLNWPYDPRECLIPAPPSARESFSSSIVSGASPYSPATQSTRSLNTPILKSPVSDEVWIISPAFENHLMKLGNWSLGPAFATALPHLADCVKIK
ncbi:hypothetical protein EJ05DRAFT_432586 [Pseudovirgaria hyperparasitica]|uniref:BZIP domain-containing protein n=1 Tax=Pseudovirgaria hyperparasitica TaxID=470096 RepID=A0A6A6WKH7_9PEZI|nr:uncharacterized protein EJ05DRAFT_432586 [Pseudovirgaria hyperparasitica]KAF2762662.1 hypothetical protein EJ05DRAFT_432586 [Pseudovirgaria hyperparasitica]